MNTFSLWKPLVPFWTLRGVRNRTEVLEVPQDLFDSWVVHASKEFPGLDVSERAFALSLSGLVDFVRAFAISRRPCILPSVSADSVWHAWLAWNDAHFEQFFKSRFDAVPSHRPSESLGVEQGVGLQNTWLSLALLDRTVPIHREMPALFRLDRKVMAPGGFAYGWDRRMVFHSKILTGREVDAKLVCHPELTGEAMMAAFALWPRGQEIIEANQKSKASNGGEGGNGNGAGGREAFDDGDSGDGGGGCGGD